MCDVVMSELISTLKCTWCTSVYMTHNTSCPSDLMNPTAIKGKRWLHIGRFVIGPQCTHNKYLIWIAKSVSIFRAFYCSLLLIGLRVSLVCSHVKSYKSWKMHEMFSGSILKPWINCKRYVWRSRKWAKTSKYSVIRYNTLGTVWYHIK